MELNLLDALQGQGYSLEDAQDEIIAMKGEVAAGFDPEEVLHDRGLEPDYIFDLLD